MQNIYSLGSDKWRRWVSTNIANNTDSVDAALAAAEQLEVDLERKIDTVKARLINGYKFQQLSNLQNGHILEENVSIITSDIPTVSGSITNPASEVSDTASQIIRLFGSDLTAVSPLSKKQSELGLRWVRGYSPYAYNYGHGGTYRLSSIIGRYDVVGNQGKSPINNYGYNGGVIYVDFNLSGDLFYTKILNGVKIWIWVNDKLIGSVATLGTGVDYNSSDTSFKTSLAGNGYIKLKFTSGKNRKIRIATQQASSIGDIYTRNINTISPVFKDPIKWVHFGDSFSEYTGASSYRVGLTEYMHSAFGRDINFINCSCGGTSFADTGQNEYGNTPVAGKKPSFYNQYKLNYINFDSIDIITCLVGINDSGILQSSVSSKVSEMFLDIRTKYKNAIIVVFCSNSSPSAISSGKDKIVEDTIVNTIQNLNLGIHTVRFQKDSIYPPFLRGTGNIAAQNGTGNTDIYTSSDLLHPTDDGHKAYGLYMADRLLECISK